MTEPTTADVRAPTQLHLLLAVLAALGLGVAAGRLSVDAGRERGPAGLQQLRHPPPDGSPVVADVAGQQLSLDQFLARWGQLNRETQRFHRQRGGPEHFLDEAAEELLLSEEAVRRGHAERPGVRESLRREVNRSLVLPLLAEEVRAKAIPERELQARFELRRDEWAAPARARVREIRVTAAPSPPGQQVEDDATSPEAAAAKARELHARLRAGELFEELAQRHSEATSAAYGGLIGWVVEGRFALAYEEAALDLAVGEPSEPLEQANGDWVILLVEAREAGGEALFEDHREELLEDLLSEDPGAVSRRYRVFVEELKRQLDYRVDPEPVREALRDASAG